MVLTGEAYLYNLSMLAIGYASVSALVMLLREMMGGKVSNFDVHLITAYISGGFAVALGALTPPLLALTPLSSAVQWGIASGLAALFIAMFIGSTIRRRRVATGPHVPPLVLLDWCLQGLAILMLLANAIVIPIQGLGLHAFALSISIAVLMWTFVRRIASLLGRDSGEDWDPKRG